LRHISALTKPAHRTLTIENAFSKLKALLRARAERSVDALWNSVGDIVKLFEPQECANYFAAAGYDPV